MGTWGVGLYDNDSAADLRDAYEALWKFGVVGKEATVLLIKELEPDEEDWGFWFALADLQWHCGILEEDIKRRVVSAIESKSELAEWSRPEERKSRTRLLANLLRKIQTAPQKTKKAPKRFIEKTVFDLGRILLFKTVTDTVVVLRVVQLHQSRIGAQFPVVEVLCWNESNEPAPEQIRQLALQTVPDGMYSVSGDWESYVKKLRVEGVVPKDVTLDEFLENYRSPVIPVRKSSERDPAFRRLTVTDMTVESPRRCPLIRPEIVGPETLWTWNRLDEVLKRCFRLAL